MYNLQDAKIHRMVEDLRDDLKQAEKNAIERYALIISLIVAISTIVVTYLLIK